MRDKLNTIYGCLCILFSGMFDRRYYLQMNPDVAAAKVYPLLHYLKYGGFEGRNPSDAFYSESYLNNYPDVRNSGMNPLLHYIRFGKAEGRSPKPFLNLPGSLKTSTLSLSDSAVLIFDHSLGGGTNRYLFDALINPDSPIPKSIVVRYNPAANSYSIKVRIRTEVKEEALYFDWKALEKDLKKIRYSKIIVNSLFSWPSTETALIWIAEYKTANPSVKVVYKGHDYYCICPSFTLQDNTHKYCGIRCDETECNYCVKSMGNNHVFLDRDNQERFSVSHWRLMWGLFFKNTADEIDVFSPSSRKIVLQAYPDVEEKLNLKPHIIRPFSCCNIAVLGYLSVHKGSEVVRKLCQYLDENQIENMQVYLFGYNAEGIVSSHLKEMGQYDRKDLPELLEKAKVDIVFIPSTCPESFCYTAGESITLGYPTVCFDLGGQADQVRASDNGLILFSEEPEDIYISIMKLWKSMTSLQEDSKEAKTKEKTRTLVIQDKVSRDFLKWMYHIRDDKSQFVPEAKDFIKKTDEMPKIIAAYLPQFHEFPENTRWFGRGFSEWTNTTQTLPQFIGHRQPHIPIDIGFYSLNNTDIMHRQVELAKKYGIDGFCVYYYWFSGKRIMDRPLNQILDDKELDFPFFLFWANDDWSMAWGNGATRETLYKGAVKSDDAEKFMDDVLPYMLDPRYIRINNKPVLLIYKIALGDKKDYLRFIQKIQAIAKQKGLDGIYLLSPIEDFMNNQNLEDVQKEYKLDALMEFHPVAGRKGWNKKRVEYMDQSCRSVCYDVEDFIINQKYLLDTKANVFPGLFPDWDNSPRRYNRGAMILQSTPENYKKWLSDLIKWTKEHNKKDERFIFVNAWNDWAEGAHLEPDSYYGYAYLQKTREALEENADIIGKANKTEEEKVLV